MNSRALTPPKNLSLFETYIQPSFFFSNVAPPSGASCHKNSFPVIGLLPDSAKFNGGEGIAYYEGKIYFATKGDNKIWCYDTKNQNIIVLYDHSTHPNPILSGVDNIVFSSSGDLFVAEDGGNMQIVAIDSDGSLVPILQIMGQDESEITGPEFNNEEKNLNDEEIDWLLSNCYQVGLISGKDLLAMGISIKKSFEALKTIASLDELILEDSAWSFMALNSIFNMLENRETRGDRRVKIAENTGLPRIKNVS